LGQDARCEAAKHRVCVCCAHERASQVTITFPDAGVPSSCPPHVGRRGSRAGFDYEDIDDLRIAVSELCILISGVLGGEITLHLSMEPGIVAVDGARRSGSAGRERVLANDCRSGRG
jgi:hypothetical protein